MTVLVSLGPWQNPPSVPNPREGWRRFAMGSVEPLLRIVGLTLQRRTDGHNQGQLV